MSNIPFKIWPCHSEKRKMKCVSMFVCERECVCVFHVIWHANWLAVVDCFLVNDSAVAEDQDELPKDEEVELRSEPTWPLTVSGTLSQGAH